MKYLRPLKAETWVQFPLGSASVFNGLIKKCLFIRLLGKLWVSTRFSTRPP